MRKFDSSLGSDERTWPVSGIDMVCYVAYIFHEGPASATGINVSAVDPALHVTPVDAALHRRC
jgi:hypothetical protein